MLLQIGTHRLSAVTARSAATLLLGDLHETLLATSTDSVGIAGGLLHSDRGNDDWRD